MPDVTSDRYGAARMALPDHLRQLAAKVSNTGRWGPDDQRGTLNLVDAAAVARGVAAARQGRPFSLAIPFDENGPQTGAIAGRANPALTMHMVNTAYTGDRDDFCTSDDSVAMGVQAATHWDALAHVSYGGRLYNDIPADVIDDRGAHRLGIENFGPVVSRGVLVDVARLHRVDHFEDGHPIGGDDLDAALARQGVTVEAGDILLVRTGQMHYLREGDRARLVELAALLYEDLSGRGITHLAFLAPDIIRSIAEGRQPPTLTADRSELVGIAESCGYRLLAKSVEPTVYDQSNFPPEYRMHRACNLLFGLATK